MKIAIVFSIIFPLLLASVAAQEGRPDSRLVKLKEHLENALDGLEPKPKIEIPDHYQGKSMILRFKPREYLIYPRSKSGKLGRKLVEAVGPDDGGIILRVHVQPKGEANQAVVPQTIKEPYWETFLNVYPAGDEKQFYVALSYRGTTDEKLIQKVKNVLKGEK